jgi:hypothetical protein
MMSYKYCCNRSWASEADGYMTDLDWTDTSLSNSRRVKEANSPAVWFMPINMKQPRKVETIVLKRMVKKGRNLEHWISRTLRIYCVICTVSTMEFFFFEFWFWSIFMSAFYCIFLSCFSLKLQDLQVIFSYKKHWKCLKIKFLDYERESLGNTVRVAP